MAIIAPTIDEFDEPTVMLIIRNLVKWVQTDLVPQINANDIVSATQTSDGLSFEINLIKGDDSKIPVGKITLEDEDNIESGSFHFDDETRMLSGTLLKEDGTPINIPAVEIPVGSGTQVDYGIQTIQFTYESNNLSCVITQNDGTQTTSNTVVIAGGGGTGGNPYPTAINGTVGEDGNITLSMIMSEGKPVTATINMSYFASVEDLEEIQTQLTEIQLNTTVAQDGTNTIKITNTINGNGTDVLLDMSVVGDELILTAEHGEQQAISKITIDNIITEDDKYYIVSGGNPDNGIVNISLDSETHTPAYAFNNVGDITVVNALNNINSIDANSIGYKIYYDTNTPKSLSYKIIKNKKYTPNSKYLFVNTQREYINRIHNNVSDMFNYNSKESRWYLISNIYIAQVLTGESYIFGVDDNDVFNINMALNIQASNNGLNIVSVKFNKDIYTERQNLNIFFSTYSKMNILNEEPNWS